MHVNSKPRSSNVQATAQAASPLHNCPAPQQLFTMHMLRIPAAADHHSSAHIIRNYHTCKATKPSHLRQRCWAA
jgi:hypothetical protein